jgi:hypothetical protein
MLVHGCFGWFGDHQETTDFDLRKLAGFPEELTMPMERVARKLKMGEAEKDSVYWRTRPVLERLAALEECRSEYHGTDYKLHSGISRVVRVSRLQTVAAETLAPPANN